MKYTLFLSLLLMNFNLNAQDVKSENLSNNNTIEFNSLDELLTDTDDIKKKLSEISKLRLENEMLSKLIDERKNSTNKKLFLKSNIENVDESSTETKDSNKNIETKDSKTSDLELRMLEAEKNRRNLINETNDKRRDFAEKQKELYKSKKELEVKERELEKELRIEKARNEKLKQLEKSLSLN